MYVPLDSSGVRLLLQAQTGQCSVVEKLDVRERDEATL